jgi:hypothetical protein
MPVQNALNITETGVISHDGNGKFVGSPITNNSVLLGSTNNKIQNTGLIPKGNLLIGNGITTPTILPVGADTQVLTADSTQPDGVKWAPPSGGVATLHGAPAPVDVNTITYFSDFLEEAQFSFWNYPSSFKNPTDITASKISNLNPGIGKISGNSRIFLSSAVSNVGSYIGSGTITMTLRVNFDGNTPLASGDKFLWGLKDTASFTSDNEAIGIIMDYDQNPTPNWLAKTTTGGVSTYTDLGISANDPNAWRVLKVVINSTATSVDFYIDGVLLATHTTNIPPVTTKFTVGTVADSLPVSGYLLDYALYNKVCTNDRS